MALAQLQYQGGHSTQLSRDKDELYDGSALGFNDWEFNIGLKIQMIKEDDKKKAKFVSEAIAQLRGDARRIAMDLGQEKLIKDDGLKNLVEEIRKIVVPRKEVEASALYKAGHDLHGVLARQKGESMMSYIGRRRRWYQMLQELDPSAGISDKIRAQLLLDRFSRSTGMGEENDQGVDQQCDRFRRDSTGHAESRRAYCLRWY